MGSVAGCRLRAVLICLTLAVCAGCGPLPMPGPRERSEQDRRPMGEGPGGRPQPLALSPRQELAVGRRTYAEVMKGFRDRTLDRDHPLVRRCIRVMNRIAEAAAIEPLQREIHLRVRGYVFEWEVNVVRDDQVNAFCLPAGKMVLFTGILRLMGEDDHYLATVLSHEMAHALAHHGSERVAMERTRQGILNKLAYSRMQEEEADHIGIFLMTFAGYDPRAGAVFWERMRRAGGKKGQPEFLSGHPSDARRAVRFREWAPKAAAALEAYRRGRIARGAER